MKRKTGFIFLAILIVILTGGILCIRYNIKNKQKKIEQCILQRIESNIYQDDIELQNYINDLEKQKKEGTKLCQECDTLFENIEKQEKTINDIRESKKYIEASLHCHRENGYSDYELQRLGFDYKEIKYGL